MVSSCRSVSCAARNATAIDRQMDSRFGQLTRGTGTQRVKTPPQRDRRAFDKVRPPGLVLFPSSVGSLAGRAVERCFEAVDLLADRLALARSGIADQVSGLRPSRLASTPPCKGRMIREGGADMSHPALPHAAPGIDSWESLRPRPATPARHGRSCGYGATAIRTTACGIEGVSSARAISCPTTPNGLDTHATAPDRAESAL